MGIMLQKIKDNNQAAWHQITEMQQTLPESPPDIFGLCKRVGHVTEKRMDMPRSLKAYISKKSETTFKLFYNGCYPRKIQRFAVAHALGHVLMHSQHLGTGHPENVMLRGGGLSTKLEIEANKLAGEVLMPDDAIDHYTKDIDGLCIAEMAEVFEVSSETMANRLGIPLDIYFPEASG